MRKYLRSCLISFEVAMRLKKKIILLLTAVISFITVTCLSGCSSIAVDGEKLTNPCEIVLNETGFSSHIDIITDRKEIEKVFSAFDGADFKLTEEDLAENDGQYFPEIYVTMQFCDKTYWFFVAENGRTRCLYNDKSYISEEGAVDYNALKEYIHKLKEKK